MSTAAQAVAETVTETSQAAGAQAAAVVENVEAAAADAIASAEARTAAAEAVTAAVVESARRDAIIEEVEEATDEIEELLSWRDQHVNPQLVELQSRLTSQQLEISELRAKMEAAPPVTVLSTLPSSEAPAAIPAALPAAIVTPASAVEAVPVAPAPERKGRRWI